MRPSRVLLSTLFALFVLLWFVPLGAAQAQVVETWLEASVDLPEAAMGRGEDAEAFVYPSFCSNQGGFNPQEGSIVLTLEATEWPDWLDVRIRTASVSHQPELGPTLQDGVCTVLDEFSLYVTTSGEAPYAAEGSVTLAISVATEGDLGTYMAPSGLSGLSDSVTTEADPGDEPALPDPDQNPTPTNNDDDTEEGPAVPVFFVLAAALVAVALRRRR